MELICEFTIDDRGKCEYKVFTSILDPESFFENNSDYDPMNVVPNFLPQNNDDFGNPPMSNNSVGSIGKTVYDGVNYLAGIKATIETAAFTVKLNRLHMYRPVVTQGGKTLFKSTNLFQETLKVRNSSRAFGFGLVGLGILYDFTIGSYMYDKHGDDSVWAVSPDKAKVNTVVTLWSLFFSPAIGTLYFGIEAFYPGGWPEAMRAQCEMHKEYREFWSDHWATPEPIGKF